MEPLSTDPIFQSLYTRGSYQDFLDSGLLLTQKLLNQDMVRILSEMEKCTSNINFDG
jgi:hypothetical protein